MVKTASLISAYESDYLQKINIYMETRGDRIFLLRSILSQVVAALFLRNYKDEFWFTCSLFYG